DGQHDEHRRLSVEGRRRAAGAPAAGEGDHGQVGGVEHQLDGQEEHDGAPPRQDPDAADGEEDGAEGDVVLGADHQWPPCTSSSSRATPVTDAEVGSCGAERAAEPRWGRVSGAARWTRLTAATTPVRSSTPTSWKASR